MYIYLYHAFNFNWYKKYQWLKSPVDSGVYTVSGFSRPRVAAGRVPGSGVVSFLYALTRNKRPLSPGCLGVYGYYIIRHSVRRIRATQNAFSHPHTQPDHGSPGSKETAVGVSSKKQRPMPSGVANCWGMILQCPGVLGLALPRYDENC